MRFPARGGRRGRAKVFSRRDAEAQRDLATKHTKVAKDKDRACPVAAGRAGLSHAKFAKGAKFF